MTTIELTSLILAFEFALVGIVAFFIMRRRQQKNQLIQQNNVEAMHQEIAVQEPSRRERLKTLFQTRYSLDDDSIDEKVEEYILREKAFYNAMLSIYLQEDGKSLKDVPEELAKVIAPWAELLPKGTVAPEEFSQLQTENVRLNSELVETKETIDRLVDEYKAAFEKYQRTAKKSH
jgi:hypothetical protein